MFVNALMIELSTLINEISRRVWNEKFSFFEDRSKSMRRDKKKRRRRWSFDSFKLLFYYFDCSFFARILFCLSRWASECHRHTHPQRTVNQWKETERERKKNLRPNDRYEHHFCFWSKRFFSLSLSLSFYFFSSRFDTRRCLFSFSSDRSSLLIIIRFHHWFDRFDHVVHLNIHFYESVFLTFAKSPDHRSKAFECRETNNVLTNRRELISNQVNTWGNLVVSLQNPTTSANKLIICSCVDL